MNEDQTPAIVLYVVPGCPLCERARGWLEHHAIAYVERDVENEFGASRRMYKHTRQSLVPTLEFNRNWFVRPTEAQLIQLIRGTSLKEE